VVQRRLSDDGVPAPEDFVLLAEVVFLAEAEPRDATKIVLGNGARGLR
jgi:hypothetical protein